MSHREMTELEAALPEIEDAPTDAGRLDLIVRRPAPGEREVIEEGQLDLDVGLVGDSWSERKSSRTEDGSPHPDMQITIMGTRVIAMFAGSEERWPLAGDQLYVDLDLSEANLPTGTRLKLGDATLEVTAQPHTGCKKFLARFGVDAQKLVSSERGRALRLRGLNAKVIVPGRIRVGDVAEKI